MTDLEFAERLSKTRANASSEQGQISNSYVLFGLKYADELRGRAKTVVALARRHWPMADVSKTADVDLAYGSLLAPYVEIIDPTWWLD